MKADKRAKIELRMEELEKELERVKQESIEWQKRADSYADKCDEWERRYQELEQMNSANSEYIIRLEHENERLKTEISLLRHNGPVDKLLDFVDQKGCGTE